MAKKEPQNIKYCHAHMPEEKSFYFDHVRIPWKEQIALHQSAEWEISYIIRGSGSRIVGEVVETFSKGEIILLPPHMPHCWSFNANDHDEEGNIENITIIFPASLLDKSAAAFPETAGMIAAFCNNQQALSFEGDTLKQLQQLMTSMCRQDDAAQLLSFFSIIMVIAGATASRVVGYSNTSTRNSAKIHEITRFMVHNYQRKISLTEMAKYTGMNRSSFCTFFKREKGKSFFSFLNEYRIDCSCLMLRETPLPVADICFAVGFEDIPYYNRTFKKIKGITPKEYRALNSITAAPALAGTFTEN